MNNRRIGALGKKVKYKSRSFLFKLYAKIKHPLFIWKLINIKRIRLFLQNKPVLDPLQKKILEDLEKNGIAVTSLSELSMNKSLSELLAYIEKRRGNRRTQNHKKSYLIDYLPEIPELGFENPFFKVAINKKILDVVNSYMGMYSMLYHFMVRETIISQGEPQISQKWNRASQEKRVCKVYIYLNDVGENAGPFMYIPKSRHHEKWGKVFAQKLIKSSLVKTSLMEKIIPKKEHLVVVGKAGTVIFCDTTGLHRGGYSTKNSRIMSTFGYGAPTYRENISYSFSKQLLEALKNQPLNTQLVLNKKWLRKTH